MSDDIIYRQAAIDKCQHRLYESALNNIGYECKADEVFSDIAQNRIQTWLEEVPSAQPERRGKWYHGEAYPHHLYCSVCYRTALPNDEYVERWGLHMNFCPNCGADMRGEQDG